MGTPHADHGFPRPIVAGPAMTCNTGSQCSPCQRGQFFLLVTQKIKSMALLELEGKLGIVFGVANKRSIAWAIAQAWHAAGAKLAFTYQGERLKDNVEELA